MRKFISLILASVCLFIGANVSAGAEGGPKRARNTVLAGDRHVFTITFKAKEPATVMVSGDGDSDLDCQVFDSNGNLIDDDLDSTDLCLLGWTPSWTGKFKIVIINRGTKDNEYTMVTN